MILFTRTMTALPGKFFELVAVNKETQALVKQLLGLEVSLYAVSGGVIGQSVSTLHFNSLSHFEESVNVLMASSEYQAMVAKGAGLVAPGAYDQVLRSI